MWENGDLDCDEQTDEAPSRLSRSSEVEIEPSEPDVHKELVTQLMAAGCGCLKWNAKQCPLQFTSEYVESMRADCQKLSQD